MVTRRQLHRNQYNVAIPNVDTVLVPPNPRRISTIISGIPPANPNNTFMQIGSAVDTSVAGTTISYTMPNGNAGVLTTASAFLRNGSPTVALQVVRGGNTFSLDETNTSQYYSPNLQLASGDIVRWTVITPAAGSSADFSLNGYFNLTNVATYVTLSFIGPAVAQRGILIFQNAPPFVLHVEHIGQAIREEIRAISSGTLALFAVLDIFEVDCPCGVDSTMTDGRFTRALSPQ